MGKNRHHHVMCGGIDRLTTGYKEPSEVHEGRTCIAWESNDTHFQVSSVLVHPPDLPLSEINALPRVLQQVSK